MAAIEEISSHSELARINFRLPQEAKDVIERAAVVSGQTITDFAIASLLERAQEVLDRYAQRILSDRDRDIFLALLAADDEPNDALQQAARRYKQLQPSK
jgi:uncharacterized protein (DUF1778 family)